MHHRSYARNYNSDINCALFQEARLAEGIGMFGCQRGLKYDEKKSSLCNLLDEILKWKL